MRNKINMTYRYLRENYQSANQQVYSYKLTLPNVDLFEEKSLKDLKVITRKEERHA